MTEKAVFLANGATGRFIKNDRFNTTVISLHFYLPLNKKNLAADALLPYVLTSCSNEFQNFTDLNLKLLKLYGAELSCSVSKSGDFLHTRISINAINDIFANANESIVGSAAELLFSLIFNPAVENGAFDRDALNRERRKTLERIESEINDKRSYARTRLISIMFKDEPYGKFIYGTKEDVSNITGHSLYEAWERLLRQSVIQLNIIGSKLPQNVFDSFSKQLSRIERDRICKVLDSNPINPIETPQIVTDTMNINQGKLAIGFSSETYGNLRETLPLLIFSDVFGGGPYSKLFSNVREKQSLCYYCSSTQRRSKGILIVDSGIEAKNYQKVIDAVLQELNDIKKGNITRFSFESSKKAVMDSLKSYYDSAAALDSWYTPDLAGDIDLTVEEAISLINKISIDDIVKIAMGIRLHTIFGLLPKEDNN